MPFRSDAAAQSDSVKPNVFISYSRKDAVFADRLATALSTSGFNAYLDKKDIAPGEPWQERLGGLIEGADAVVFLISPDAIDSEICSWEVNEAERLSKRILPVVCRTVLTDRVPGRLQRLNWIFFTEANNFDAAFGQLKQALLIDIHWVRELTRLASLAERWVRGGRSADQLMSEADIKATERLLEDRPKNAELPPQSLIEFRDGSRARLEEELRRLRRAVGRAFVKPAQRENEDAQFERALHLSAAGAILAKDLDFELVPELWAPAAKAIFGRQSKVVLHGHREAVMGASFRPDGTWVITASVDGTARVWVPQTGSQVASLPHKEAVVLALFSHDGRRILTASYDGIAHLWDAETATKLYELTGHNGPLLGASFSPDGQKVVTASEDCTARIWNAETGTMIAVLETPRGAVNDVSFSPDGRFISTASSNGKAQVWDARSGRLGAILEGHENKGGMYTTVRTAKFSPDGRRVVTSSSDHTARVWDAVTGACLFILEGHEKIFKYDDGSAVVADPKLALMPTDGLWDASFSPDGLRIATSASDKTARLWDSMTGKEIAVLKGHDGVVHRALFSPSGHCIVTTSEDKTARVWDGQTGSAICCLRAHEGEVLGAAFNSNDSMLVTTSADSTARVWAPDRGPEISRFDSTTYEPPCFDLSGHRIVTRPYQFSKDSYIARVCDVDTGRELARLRGHEREVSGAWFAPDGRRVVTSSADNTARVWDPESGTQLLVLEGHEHVDDTSEVSHASFSPDGSKILTAGSDRTVRVWDARSGAELACHVHEDDVSAAYFSPDGRNILTGSDKPIVWDLDTGAKIAHQGWVTHTSWSPDGLRIVTVLPDSDSTARVVEAGSGKELAVLSGHSGQIVQAAFSPNGLHIVTGSSDTTARVWDARSGEPLLVLRGHTGELTSVSFSSDGYRILTGSDDQTARMWDARRGVELLVVPEQTEASGPRVLAAFCPDGRRIVTQSEFGAHVWDVSRTAVISQRPSIVLAAALDCGRGLRTESGHYDLLMSDAPRDLYAEACARITESNSAVLQVAETLRADLHANCYLSPSQFDRQFDLYRSGPEATNTTDLADQTSVGAVHDDGPRAPANSKTSEEANKACSQDSPVSVSPTRARRQTVMRTLWWLTAIGMVAGVGTALWVLGLVSSSWFTLGGKFLVR